jgi:hypothetical protein
MNKLKIVLVLLLIAPIYSVIAPAGSPLTQKVCAQTPDRGNRCIDNPSTCPAGYKNVSQANLQFFGMSLNNFATSIAATSGYNNKTPSDMCIPDTFTQVIETWASSPDSLDLNSFESRFDVGASLVFIPKACPSGWSAQQAPTGYGNGWSNPFGCCPSGYRFVVDASNQNALASQSGICCRPGRGGVNATYWKQNEGCAYNAGGGAADTAPWSGVNPPDFPGNLDQLNTAIANGSGPEAIRRLSVQQPANFPTLGLPLGPSSSVGLVVGTRTSAPRVCPSNSQCTIQAGGDINAVENANVYNNNPNSNCGNCYTAGDTIGVVNSNAGAVDNPTTPVNESIGFVRYCDPTAPNGLYRDETLIGNSDITRGFLLEDATNKPLYQQCFDDGGIYTAIGCVDPSPTGIITGLIRIALGVMGGVALLQLIYVGILYQQGNEEKIKGARTQLIATITGLAVLVFSVLILRIIGVNILDTVPIGSV